MAIAGETDRNAARRELLGTPREALESRSGTDGKPLGTTRGRFNGPRREPLLEDLEAEDHSRSRLTILRGLMIRAGVLGIVDALDDHRAFRPWTHIFE